MGESIRLVRLGSSFQIVIVPDPREMDSIGRQAKAEEAGHLLYNSMRAPSITDSQSGPPSILQPYVVEDPRKFSAVRRTFCLIVLFDLILTFLSWVIFTQLAGLSPIQRAFVERVLEYSIYTSLFDLVMLAAVRFVILQLAYALCRVKNPWFVALTTFITCAFLLVKVFLYEFNDKSAISPTTINNTMKYVLLLMTFVMSWAETWFLDFKVLPREKKNFDRAAFLNPSIDERSSLLGPSALPRYDVLGNEKFYSPIPSEPESEEGSIQGDDFRSLPPSRGHSRSNSRSSTCTLLAPTEEEYLEKARACFDVVWTLYTSQDGWERCSAEDASALVEARNLPKIGKVFKLSGVIDIDPTSLFEEIYYNLSDSPQWNPTVLECKMIQAINECTDVFYSVAAEAAGGVVSARDLLNLRQWVVRDGVHIVTGVSCEHPDMPERKEYVRAENRPGAFIIEDVASDPDKARFVWILNTDLKGWIPKTLVDSALCSVMLDFFKHLKLRCEEIVNTSSRMSSTDIQEV